MEVWTDLLKFRRGIQRHQIAVGVILHDNPANLYYVYHHLRLISEPLFQRATGRVRRAGRRGTGDGCASKQSPLRSLPDAQRSGCLTVVACKDFLNLCRRLSHFGGQKHF